MAKRVDFTHEQIDFIVSEYEAKAPLMGIAEKFGLKTIKAIQRILRANGFTKFKQPIRQRNINIDEAVKLYKSGLSQKKVGELLNTNQSTVSLALRENGVEIRPRTTLRTHFLREDAFDGITEESAYWMGFLMADGYVAPPIR
jgi:hypothetical protein